MIYTFTNNDTLTKGGDTLTKGRYTFQREIHFSNNGIMIHFPNRIHFLNNDTLTKGRYTYQREIHLPKGDTLRIIIHRIMIHFPNSDTLFE